MLVSIKSIGKGSVPVRQTLFSYETIRTAQFNHLSPKAPVHPSNNPSGRNHNTAKRNPEITRRCKPDTRETKQRNNGSAQDGANILWPNWQSSACFIDFSKEFLLDQSVAKAVRRSTARTNRTSSPVRNVEPSTGGENLDLMQFRSGSSCDSERVRAARRHA